MVRKLLEVGAQMSNTILHAAAKTGQVRFMKYYVRVIMKRVGSREYFCGMRGKVPHLNLNRCSCQAHLCRGMF